MELQFEEITSADIIKIRELQPETWPDIVPEFEFYIRENFCFPIKALQNHKIIGVGTIIVFGTTAWLAHIIVDKKHRNGGFGSQITERLIKEGRDKSVKTLLLIATELGFPVYRKLGFSTVSEYIYLWRDKPWRSYLLSPNIYPFEDKFESKIYELDERISGENRRLLLKGLLDNALVYFQNGRLEGFYLPDLGEGVIFASTTEAGLELMKIKYSKADKAVLPEQNHVGTDFLKQNGFVPANTKGTRMILGEEITWNPEQVYGRIGGNYG